MESCSSRSASSSMLLRVSSATVQEAKRAGFIEDERVLGAPDRAQGAADLEGEDGALLQPALGQGGRAGRFRTRFVAHEARAGRSRPPQVERTLFGQGCLPRESAWWLSRATAGRHLSRTKRRGWRLAPRKRDGICPAAELASAARSGGSFGRARLGPDHERDAGPWRSAVHGVSAGRRRQPADRRRQSAPLVFKEALNPLCPRLDPDPESGSTGSQDPMSWTACLEGSLNTWACA